MLQTLINFILTRTPVFYWTQSLWRDEAFSVWISKHSFWNTILHTASDFNPPFYYLLLNLWIKLFGQTEIVMRILSIIPFILTLIIIYKFVFKITKIKKWAIIAVLLTALNPMLVYYAFEVRMYSWLVFFASLSMYSLYSQNYIMYILSSALGIYTQPFMFLLLIAQIPYYLITKKIKTGLLNAGILLLLYLPWLPIIISQFKQSGPMWMYPIDLNLILSSLGNLFTGYEGTPGNMWNLMKTISLFLIIAAIYLLKKPFKDKNVILLILSWIFIPLIIVLSVSLKKPIYVNRYLIFIAIGEILLLTLFLHQIKNSFLGKFLLILTLFACFLSNFIAIQFHRKVNLQQTFKLILPQLKTTDKIYAATPLVYYESLYYSPNTTPVYLYNPDKITLPKYVGSGGMPKSVWQTNYPKFPNRAFLILENGEYDIVSSK